MASAPYVFGIVVEMRDRFDRVVFFFPGHNLSALSAEVLLGGWGIDSSFSLTLA